jgi:hypothetical protein
MKREDAQFDFNTAPGRNPSEMEIDPENMNPTIVEAHRDLAVGHGQSTGWETGLLSVFIILVAWVRPLPLKGHGQPALGRKHRVQCQ